MPKTAALPSQALVTKPMSVGGVEVSFASTAEMLMASVILQLVFILILLAKWIFSKEAKRQADLLSMVEELVHDVRTLKHTMPTEASIEKTARLKVLEALHQRGRN